MSEKIKSLIKDIENTINTPALEITINKPKIDSFKKSLEKVINNNLDSKNRIIEKKLSEMGMSNSSNALGAQISLAREKTEALIDSQLKISEYAEEQKNLLLKQKRGILEILIQERDKKQQLNLKYFQTISTSIVIVTVIKTYSSEVKAIFLAIIQYFKSFF